MHLTSYLQSHVLDHITPVILLTFKAMPGTGPFCLNELLQPYRPPRLLRSSNKDFLTIPKYNLSEILSPSSFFYLCSYSMDGNHGINCLKILEQLTILMYLELPSRRSFFNVFSNLTTLFRQYMPQISFIVIFIMYNFMDVT